MICEIDIWNEQGNSWYNIKLDVKGFNPISIIEAFKEYVDEKHETEETFHIKNSLLDNRSIIIIGYSKVEEDICNFVIMAKKLPKIKQIIT